MKKEYFIDNISDETLAGMIDGVIRLEKNKENKSIKYNLLKIIPVAAVIFLVIGIINILPYINSQQFNSGSNGTYGTFENLEIKNNGSIVDIFSSDANFGTIDDKGKVEIYGNNMYGQCDVPDEYLPPIKKIGIGAYCVIALGEDGKLYGWGKNEYGAMDFLGIDGTFIDVGAGGYNTGAVSSDGKVYKWGTPNMGGQEYVPLDLPPIVSIQCNMYATTVMDADGNVYKWGISNNNNIKFKYVKAEMAAVLAYDTIVLGKNGKIYGEIPNNNMNSKYKKQPDIKNIKSIYGGITNVAAIDDEGKVYIWGQYDYYPGVLSVLDVPDDLPPMVKIVFQSYYKAYGLGQDGKVYQWGSEGFILPYEQNYSDSAVVSNSDEFAEALQNKTKTIYINGIIDIKADSANIYENQEIYIMPGAVLNIYTQNFYFSGDLINDGNINVYGRWLMKNKEPTKFGVVNNFDNNQPMKGEISYYCSELNLNEIKYILNGDLPFNGISMVGGGIVLIDEDYTLPEETLLWLNSDTTLKIAKNVTFTVNGTVETYNKIINEGEIIGNIKISK